MNSPVNFHDHVPPEEVIHTLLTGCPQVIHRLIHDRDTVEDLRYYHAKGQAARLTHKWGVFMELAGQERSVTNALRLLVYMEGASGEDWKTALSALVRALQPTKAHHD